MSTTQQNRQTFADQGHLSRNWLKGGVDSLDVYYMDLISEGPIDGLVGGAAGVFLGGTRLIEQKYSPTNEATGSSVIRLSNGVATASIQTTSPTNVKLLQDIDEKKVITVLAGQGSLSVSAKEAAWVAENNSFPALRLTTLSGSSFFTTDMVGSLDFTPDYRFEIDKENFAAFFINVGEDHPFNTGDKVKYIRGSATLGGLTNNQTYFVRLFGYNAISLHTTLNGAVSGDYNSLVGAIQFDLTDGTSGDRSTLRRQASAGDLAPPVSARLKGVQATGFSDIEGKIVRRIDAQNAFFVPGGVDTPATGIPPSGVYTVEVDKNITTTTLKPLSLFTGLTQGGLLHSHQCLGEYDNYYEKWYPVLGQNEQNNFEQAYQGKKWVKWPADPGSGFEGNTAGADNFIRDEIAIAQGGAEGNIFIGYFLVPETGYYNFELTGTKTAGSSRSTGGFMMFIGSGAERTEGHTFSNAFIAKKSRGQTTDSKEARIYLYKNVYTPIMLVTGTSQYINFNSEITHTFKWRAEGGTYSTDLSQHFYAPNSRNWVAREQLALEEAWTGASEDFDFVIQGQSSLGRTGSFLGEPNFKNASIQFRTGTSYTYPIKTLNLGHKTLFEVQTAISNTPNPNTPLEVHTDYVRTGHKQDTEDNVNQGVASTIIQALSPTGLNITAGQLPNIDFVQINFDYPNGLHQRNPDNGNLEYGAAYYQIEIEFKEVGESSFNGQPIILADTIRHDAKTTSSRTFSHAFDITGFRPFKDFRFIIKRKSVHTGKGYLHMGLQVPTKNYDGEIYATSQIGLCSSFDRTILNYPNTAYSVLSFNTSEFQETPSRLYHTRGLKVKIPNNYIPREESSTGVAKYTRKSLNPPFNYYDSGTYADWDGTFRTRSAYTNNPAWIFYDILTNKRYGLGDFVSADDLDIYSLYRVARYCDDLVPDGRGGLEPRFTCNVYITKKVEAYKLLKDLATVFRGIIYWHNGKLTPVIDQEKDPVYTFTQANVLDGAFSYEGSGSKTRANQLTVTWNNPNNEYKLESLLVEDSKNISETGKIILQDSVAVGCTSKKQAERYGKWKLWTAINQTEVVTFQASLDSQFLSPGDIVNIVDSRRTSKRFAGRVTSDTTKTLSTTQIPLDATTFIDPANSYKLFITHGKPGAYLAQEDTSISENAANTITKTFKRGEYVPNGWLFDGTNYNYGAIDTEAKAANAKATRLGLDALNLHWSDSVITEERDVVIPGGHQAGDALTSLTVSSAFSEAPKRNSLWLLEERTATDTETTASGKMYKILNLSYSKDNLATITAVEHYNEKFEDIETSNRFLATEITNTEGVEGSPIATNAATEVILVDTQDEDGNTIKVPVDLPVNEVPSINDLIFEVLDDYEM